MSTPTDSHAATTPAPDVVDADYGTMNRELLADKLSAAYWGAPQDLHALHPSTSADWLRVVDVALAELQG